MVCQIFDFFFFFFFFHFKIWYNTSKKGKIGEKRFQKTQLTLNIIGKRKKQKKRYSFFLLWEVSETKEVLHLFVLVCWEALPFT